MCSTGSPRRASTRSTPPTISGWVPGNSSGESETIIGEWVKARGNRNRVIIITKVGSPMGKGKEGLKAHYIAEAVEASLKRLQVDAIDLYLSHWPDMATPIEETLGAYQRLIEQGKIRWCSASNLSVKLLEAALAASKAKGLPRYEVLQPEYNLADRHEFEGGLADLCQRKQIRVITYFSLAKGFLSGKYRSEADLSKSPRGDEVKAYLNPRGFLILDALEAVAASRRAKPQKRARLGHGEARRRRANRQRHLDRTDRQPRARYRAYADGRRHGCAQRGQRVIARTAAGRTRPPSRVARRETGVLPDTLWSRHLLPEGREKVRKERASFRTPYGPPPSPRRRGKGSVASSRPGRVRCVDFARLPRCAVAAQDLANCRVRERLAELDLARRLVAGQMLAAVSDESGFGQRRVLAHDDELDRLSGPGVWDADRAGLEHAGWPMATSWISFG